VGITPRIKQLKTPLLVLGAADDTIISPKEIEATGQAYGTKAEIFPGMAHDMMLEEGWQMVADRIVVWINSLGL
jgi:alpha-beta hydrolase superfamily lysophospholipase